MFKRDGRYEEEEKTKEELTKQFSFLTYKPSQWVFELSSQNPHGKKRVKDLDENSRKIIFNMHKALSENKKLLEKIKANSASLNKSVNEDAKSTL